jgi:RHS repeat-associated protein
MFAMLGDLGPFAKGSQSPARKDSLTTTLYLLDTLNPSGYVQVLEELIVTGGTTTLSKAYTYSDRLISQRQPGVSTNFFIFDGHGNTRAIANPGGSLVEAYSYDAYGNLIVGPAIPATGYLYCGEQFDSDLNSYYLRSRYLHQSVGRFLTRDSFGGVQAIPMSLHKYLYGHADPIDNLDPTGRDIWDFAGFALDLSSLALRSLAGHCGPDATSATDKVLESLEQQFNNSGTSREKKRSSCEALYNPETAEKAWDIIDFKGMGNREDYVPNGLKPSDLGTRGCTRTVVYNNNCVYASALNYMLFGKMNKLCNKEFARQPYMFAGLYPVTWTLDDALTAVRVHKGRIISSAAENDQASCMTTAGYGQKCECSVPWCLTAGRARLPNQIWYVYTFGNR